MFSQDPSLVYGIFQSVRLCLPRLAKAVLVASHGSCGNRCRVLFDSNPFFMGCEATSGQGLAGSGISPKREVPGGRKPGLGLLADQG